jgi:hypothetical protein
MVGKGSALAQALEKSEAEAKKVHAETSERYNQQYNAEDRIWFSACQKRFE